MLQKQTEGVCVCVCVCVCVWRSNTVDFMKVDVNTIKVCGSYLSEDIRDFGLLSAQDKQSQLKMKRNITS